MPQTKTFTAKRTLKLDCGHTIKSGDPFVVTTVYSCKQEAPWPWRILMACFHVIQQKREQQTKQTQSSVPDPAEARTTDEADAVICPRSSRLS